MDKGGLPLVQHSIACTLLLCGERLRGQGCVLLKTRRPLAAVLDLAQNSSPSRDFLLNGSCSFKVPVDF